jgi:predicted nucleotidyltransferase
MQAQLTAAQIAVIREWASTTCAVAEVRLFGSHVKGEARPDSDIDLVVTLAGQLHP